VPDLIRALHEVAHYPPHPPRQPTALFTANHKAMCIDEDQPCHICGVSHSTLSEPEHNRYGAIQMESHHYYVEDSLILAVDIAKFNARLLPALRKRFPLEPMYATPFTQAQFEEWAHGHRHNLMTLCDIHHRHGLVGIHEVTYPIWSVADLIRDDFDLTGFVAHSPAEALSLTALPQTTGMATPPEPLLTPASPDAASDTPKS